MEKFVVLGSIAAPLDLANINTDIILPARYLKTIERTGLGKFAFYSLRYDDHGVERAEFILNRPGYRHAQILLAGENFGCGSSREHAPWALADLGIRCIMAPSFADIFFHNCFKNGILCVTLPQDQLDRMMALAVPREGAPSAFTVDLNQQTILMPDGASIAFAIDPAKKAKLLNGLDDIDQTLKYRDIIARFESARAARQPWGERVIQAA